ncbi:MAG TPA: NDP-sugar synthase [Methanosarcinales archaeon]|nr:NDP-sugar synthase [Methanosarcinales archaeon]
MKACIMCGGKGTRLRPMTLERPKPLIPLLNKPSVTHLIEHLRGEGFTDIVMTLGYLSDMIESEVSRINGINIRCVYEETALGTAGGVKNARAYLEDGIFMVVGGDHVLDMQLDEIYRFHERNDAMVTIGLICIDDPSEYGICDMDSENVIHRFLEKPNPGEVFSNLVNTGIYVCDPEILDWIPDGEMYDFAKNVFPDLLDAGKQINGYLVQGNWTDIGNHEMYRAACRWKLNRMFDMPASKHRHTLASARIKDPVAIADGVDIGSSMIVGPVMIGEDTSIGDHVLIGPYTTIGSGCVIEDDVHILTSYVYDNVHIEKGSAMFSSIVDNDVHIHKNCTLETGTVLGQRVVVLDDVIISGVQIWHGITVPEGEHVMANMTDAIA